jgi:hypothetical protein
MTLIMNATVTEIYSQEIIGLGEEFPDLKSLQLVYPGAISERPDLNDYAYGLELQGRYNPAVADSIAKAKELQASTNAIVYIAGPLTGTSEGHKARYGQISDLLASFGSTEDGARQVFFGYAPHLHGTDPIKHPDVSSEAVRDIDYIWGRIVPAFTVNCLYPTAHGNAIEAGWEENTLVPAIMMNPRDNKLSRLTKGLNNVMLAIEYDDFESDGLEALELKLDEVHAWMQHFPNRDVREFFYLNYENIRTPSLVLHELDPAGFHPVFNVKDALIYIKDTSSPYYGMAGNVVYHDWKESGEILLSFPDGGTTILDDQSNSFTYWRRIDTGE